MSFPTMEELEGEYGHHLDDPAFHALSNWIETNHDEPMDEAAYLERIERTGPALLERLFDVVDKMHDTEGSA